jgi:hypothetical protein
MVRLKERASSSMVIALYFAEITRPAAAQSTDPTRPGGCFSLSQIGRAPSQALKNDGIYLSLFCANNILGDMRGDKGTRVISTGDARFGADSDLNTIAGIPDAAVRGVSDDRSGNHVSSHAGARFSLPGQNGPFEATINKGSREQISAIPDSFGQGAPSASDDRIFEVCYGIALAPGVGVRPAGECVARQHGTRFYNPAPGDAGVQVSSNFNALFDLPASARAN